MSMFGKGEIVDTVLKMLGGETRDVDFNAVETFLNFLEGEDPGKKVASETEHPNSNDLVDRYEYEGETKRGIGRMAIAIAHGNGKMTWPNGDKYEGGFENGAPHGGGVYRSYANGETFTGNFAHGKRNGQGLLEWDDSLASLHAEWEDDRIDGPVLISTFSGFYTGEWRGKGEPHGEGKDIDRHDENVYEGQYQRGLRHGKGKAVWSDGSEYIGEWRGGKQHGKGTYTSADGEKREGTWRDGKEVDDDDDDEVVEITATLTATQLVTDKVAKAKKDGKIIDLID